MKTIHGCEMGKQTPFIQACYTGAEKLKEVLRQNYESMPEGNIFSADMAALLVDEVFTHDEACWLGAAFIAHSFSVYKMQRDINTK